MSKLRNQILGKPSGRVGDIVFKSLYGSTLIVSPPLHFTTPMDEQSVQRRSKFRFAIKITSKIFGAPMIKLMWKKASMQGLSGFNKLFKVIYPAITDGQDISEVKLYDQPGFVLNNPEVTVNPSSIKVDMDAIGQQIEIDTSVEKKVSLEGVIYLSSPLNAGDEPYRFLSLTTPDKDLALDTALSFSNAFNTSDQQIFQKYAVKKVLFALVTKDANGQPVHVSTTSFN